MLKKSVITILGVAIAFSTSYGTLQAPAKAASDFPEATLKVPKLLPEESVSTYVPSQAAPGAGIAVNMIYPEKPRYKDGAPVAVIAPGGAGADGLTFTMHAAQAGFIELRMAFPGGGSPKFQSGGIYDYRGSQSQTALKDVLLFAAGKIPDTKGHFIGELLPVKVATTNVGLVGWSNGGNIAMVTLGKFSAELNSIVNWVVFYESPIGQLFFPPNLGGTKDLLTNKHYRQGSAATGSCNVDWKKLAWDPAILRNSGEHKKLGEPELPGVLYFDENKNGVWDESVEFALNYAMDVGLDKQIYPPEVCSALMTMKMFDRWVPDVPDPREQGNSDHQQSNKPPPPKKPVKGAAPEPAPKQKVKHIIAWPKRMATLRESETFYGDRDGSAYYAQIAKDYPFMMVTVIGTYIDHLQKQPDHPHIAMQYNAWLAHKVHWVRLNPESCYPALMTIMNSENFTNNKPNATIDASTIANYLEGEGTTKDYVLVEAAIAELADRRRAKNLSFPLLMPLTVYYNSANPPPPPPVPKKEQ
jgi:hypothetical protein